MAHMIAASRHATADHPTMLRRVDGAVARWTQRHAVPVLRVSIAIVYLWFGALKFVPGWSPAESLASRTIAALTLGLVPPDIAVVALAVLETAIGVGLLTGRAMRLTLAGMLLQMAGAATPLLLFPHETFTRIPFAPTLEGQYIIKNLVLVSAALLLAGTVARRDTALR